MTIVNEVIHDKEFNGGPAMTAVAAMIAVLFAGSTVLTPLYIIYKQAFGFSQVSRAAWRRSRCARASRCRAKSRRPSWPGRDRLRRHGPCRLLCSTSPQHSRPTDPHNQPRGGRGTVRRTGDRGFTHHPGDGAFVQPPSHAIGPCIDDPDRCADCRSADICFHGRDGHRDFELRHRRRTWLLRRPASGEPDRAERPPRRSGVGLFHLLLLRNALPVIGIGIVSTLAGPITASLAFALMIVVFSLVALGFGLKYAR